MRLIDLLTASLLPGAEMTLFRVRLAYAGNARRWGRCP